MPVFISYSHQDKEFAEKLALHLLKHRARVWIDCWELKVGDSIIERIQSAIKTADALIVILTKASVASEWCKKELSAALMRELQEKRVVVLPLLLEDCQIPTFLKDKKYADFRRNFDEGLKETLTAIATVISDTQGRMGTADYHIDWALESGTVPGTDRYEVRVNFVDHSEKLTYSILTQVHIICNEPLSKRQQEYERRGLGWMGRLILITSLHEAVQKHGFGRFVLEGSQPAKTMIGFDDRRTGFVFEAHISSRALGMDTGFKGLFEWSDRIHGLFENLSKNVSPEDRANLRRALKEGSMRRQ